MNLPENSVSSEILASASWWQPVGVFLHGGGNRLHPHETESLYKILARAKEMSQLQPYNRSTVSSYIDVMSSIRKAIRNR